MLIMATMAYPAARPILIPMPPGAVVQHTSGTESASAPDRKGAKPERKFGCRNCAVRSARCAPKHPAAQRAGRQNSIFRESFRHEFRGNLRIFVRALRGRMLGRAARQTTVSVLFQTV